ncbi:MAG: autotransporter outer membrane beta-barrel domain-containing protein [Allisonella histaminiformans]|uniref:autotransporter family protein n=1 Tax=Allisonella histaminiformans TaxID=209880 RepID=UPI002A8175F4|nr:autotransporter outer membrane beta-barrel domain-containing protein [Allisonella histaminiformans]MDY3957459.1 autotransporter outer membrane beta-barrel domain-containing protein [Allisonella histaminiformans]
MKECFRKQQKAYVFWGGTKASRKFLTSVILSALLAVPCTGLAADITSPLASDKTFSEDTKVTGTNGVKTSSNAITIDAGNSTLTLDNTNNGIVFSNSGQKITIKAKELNILNAEYGIHQGSSSNNEVSVDGVVNISGTQFAVDSNANMTLNLNGGLNIKDNSITSQTAGSNAAIRLENWSTLNTPSLSIENVSDKYGMGQVFGLELYGNSWVNANELKIENLQGEENISGIYTRGAGVRSDSIIISDIKQLESGESTNYDVSGIHNQGGGIEAKDISIKQIDGSNVKGTAARGLYMDNYGTYVAVDNLTIDTVKGQEADAFGIWNQGQTLFNHTGDNSTETVRISNISSNKDAYGFYADKGGSKQSNNYIKKLSITNVEGENSYGIFNKDDSIVTVDENAVIKNLTANTLKQGVHTEDQAVTNLSGSAEIAAETALFANGNAKIEVNSSKQGTVKLTGKTMRQDDAVINAVLNNASSYWHLTGDSTLTDLELSNNALLDMGKDSGKFSSLKVNKLDGDKGKINMDIDASTNTNNSDRLYIAGTHTGNHYITLNNVNADSNNDGAAGTVLVSVKDEQGNFFANDKEGSLYWNKYTLDKQDSATDGYTKDWYLKKVEFIPSKPTTSVDAVDATQRLAFANWVEDDKLMQRMGDLRNETNNEEGVWVRVKGGKYSGDGFSNRHTMYQLGYDDVVKNTDKLKRYQGVAFSYDDGKNSFNRGSGKLKAKSIGFYSTDLRNKGHYLDLALKIYDADSDFTVFDTEGKKITGAFDNTGISLSAEYGRKKYLDEHWSIEPQAQLTLGYLGGASYTTSNGIHVSQSDPNSVLGRIGCNFKYDMDEKNTVYLKVNWLHQFAGNYGVTLTNGNDSLRIDNHDHDTWFEYGLGFACMTGKNNYLYADVERSTGGSLRKNWQWNAGMFWTF